MIRTKRVYAPPAPEDGYRVLVDRLWPRGLTRQAAAIDLWLRDIAPSPALRKWFGHDAGRWQEFTVRYRDELAAPERAAALDRLRSARRERGAVTLLYAAREETRNPAAFLAGLLNDETRRRGDRTEP